MKTRSCRTKFWHLLLCSLAAGGLLLGAQPASAGNCIQDAWAAHGNTQSLTCTANDVRIAEVTNIDIISGGSCTGTGTNKTCTCNAGQNVTFSADYKVVLTAQTRYDIGLYFGVDGDPNGDGALTGQCKVNIITQGEEVSPSTFVNLDPTPDVCGDIDSAHNPQLLHLTVTTACVAGPDGKLKLPNCTSWRQPGSNEVCQSALDAFPGSPSKCNCQPGFEVNIFVEHPSITVTKAANPTQVDEGPVGGPVTYTVNVTNNGTVASVTINSLSDNVYGNITTAHAAGGGFQAVTSTTCSVPRTITPQGTYTCSFVATVSGLNAGQSVTDTVCASGTDSNGGAVGPTCGTAAVSARDVIPTGSVAKSLNQLLCADVRYTVIVTNTDPVETLTLSALTDDGFGDITTVHGNVLATTCVVPGILAANGGQYTCTFDAHFCGAQHTDTVTATLSDDEGNTITPSGSATVSVSAQ